ncbi:MAG: hypothetical protein IK024_07100 [Treponema sp.]|nr:hypothetical protein [Treponema sp.]
MTSCDDFLKAKETRAEIEKAIDYANASVYSIKVEADKDSGIITKPAAGEARVKVTDTFNLSFHSEQDYQFIKWEVYNEATNQPIENGLYLQIEDPKKIDTNCSVLSYPNDSNIQLAVRAIAAERPQIILARPQYSETGAPRFSNIEISFNKSNMDPSCIYYSEPEMTELIDQLGLSESDFLKGDETLCNNQYYGYKDQEGHKHFKNIQFSGIKLTDSGDYTAEFPGDYFYNPYFIEDSGFSGCRLIYQMMNPPIQSKVTVYYSLNKDFCYMQDDIPVKMLESKPYAYETMLKESERPGFTQDFNYVNFLQVKVGDDDWKSLAVYQLSSDDKLFNEIPELSNTTNIEFKLNFEAQDTGGSGLLPSFSLSLITKNYIPNYGNEIEILESYSINYSSVVMNGSKGTPPDFYTIDRTTTTELKDVGEYKFELIIYDNDTNSEEAWDGPDANHKIPVYFKLKLTQPAATN